MWDLIISSTSASSSIKSLYYTVDADFVLRISVFPVNLYVFPFLAKFSLSFSSEMCYKMWDEIFGSLSL